MNRPKISNMKKATSYITSAPNNASYEKWVSMNKTSAAIGTVYSPPFPPQTSYPKHPQRKYATQDLMNKDRPLRDINIASSVMTLRNQSPQRRQIPRTRTTPPPRPPIPSFTLTVLPRKLRFPRLINNGRRSILRRIWQLNALRRPLQRRSRRRNRERNRVGYRRQRRLGW